MVTRSPRPSRGKSSKRPRPFRWTRAWLARLPDDGNRYEVLGGELLVTPQARYGHQEVSARLIEALRPYCRAHAIGTVVGPGAVVWNQNELQPDVEVVPGAEPPGLDAEWTDFPLPLLVVEVLSPGSERHDRYKKRDAYLGLGIPEYWIVDLEKRCVLVSRPDGREPRVVTDELTWQPRPEIEPLTIDVRALLAG